ncbi:MAG TPA: hypothetical protein DHD79_06590 [Firmicutes bacterium]|jgi:Cu/Ag efflux protein CusF|nr:hypothetical protein [Bacillota bacterium]HAW71340.1 hypothetical protein [Bacillota bacterium]HAZ21878.1 hypothetical protein [Bacillota bacterium]HBE06881.1 hypothetical protein [Bacillota bacterium]HBG44592.1 hypothetical protein [Bacillota bacterium]
MNLLRRIAIITFLTTACLLLLAFPASAALDDIRGNWAETAIRDLKSAGIINGYPDGTFKPDRSLTRAEFAKLVVETFDLPTAEAVSFPDTRTHWAKEYISAVGTDYMTGYADGAFRPERNISRAEAAAVITRIMKLGTDNEKPLKPWNASFADVPREHWAFQQIEIARHIGILPNYESNFAPDRALQRDEVAWMLWKAHNLNVVTGSVAAVDLTQNKLTVLPDEGDLVEATVDLDTAMFRNNVGTELNDILDGDEVRVVLDASGNARYVKSYGAVNSNDLAARASSYLKGRITPDQIQAIVAGDWESVKANFKGELYDQLLKYGATPAEAETILMADWGSLTELGRERLADSIAAELGLDPSMVALIMGQNLGGLLNIGSLSQLGQSGTGSTLLGQLLQFLPGFQPAS